MDEATYRQVVKNLDLLLNTVKLAYRKHHLGDDTIGWDYLSDTMKDTLCEVMGDERYTKWLKKVTR